MTLRVPYIVDESIERDAEALLAQFAHARGVAIRAPIPIEDIIEKHLKLHVEFNDLHRLLEIPRGGFGTEPDIFGAIWLEAGEIVIDESLDPEVRLTIEGHTCNIGTAEYNLALGDRRANAVKDYLVSRGIGTDRLQTISYGEERPKYDNAREETRRLNRRAALVVRLQ